MRPFGSWLAGLATAIFILGAPFGYVWYRNQHFRNFRTVRTGVLYRSGQLTAEGLARICHDHGIRTVITLRDAHQPGEPPPDFAEENYCNKMDIRYVRLPPKCWWAETGPAPADENVKEFLRIMDEPRNHPVLIHCFAGTHRTGAYCCIYRMEYEHWNREAALDELHACGYVHLYEEEDVLGYLQNYRPRQHVARGCKNQPAPHLPVSWSRLVFIPIP